MYQYEDHEGIDVVFKLFEDEMEYLPDAIRTLILRAPSVLSKTRKELIQVFDIMKELGVSYDE